MIELHEQTPAGRTLGGYEILLRLKSGGMGDVLLARRIGAGGFEKLVALKTIRADLRGAAHLRTMFLDEAKLLARLNHPAIAQVYDFGEEGEDLFLAMEYVEGIRFRAFAERRPPAAVSARAMADVCRGLHAAHELTDLAGNPMVVVHRDVSPENLMLTFAGRVKILDFGIALMRGRQAPATELGTIKGKPPYLSPEQLKNEPVDRRTDIFSAAIVLHELLTGQPLFVGDSVYAVARAIEHEDPLPPSRRAGPLPAGLDEAVLRALARAPEQRYSTALEFAEELDRIAIAAGGESLEVYAQRELRAEHEAHRRQLQGLLARVGSTMTGTGWQGRPSGVLTAQAGEADLRTPPAVDAPDLSTADIAAVMAAASPRVGRRLALGALLLLLAGVAIALVWGWPGARDRSKSSSSDGPGALAAVGAEVADAGSGAIGARDAAPALAGDTPVLDAASAPSLPTPAKVGRSPRRPRNEPEAVEHPGAVAVATGEQPTGVGFLTVAAEPFALVRIDGEEAGSTPIIKRRIPEGKHEVVLTSPDSGEVRLRRTVEVKAGGHEQVILR